MSRQDIGAFPQISWTTARISLPTLTVESSPSTYQPPLLLFRRITLERYINNPVGGLFAEVERTGLRIPARAFLSTGLAGGM